MAAIAQSKYSLNVEVGGIPFAIEFEDQRSREKVQNVYAPFSSQKVPRYKIEVKNRESLRDGLVSAEMALSFKGGIYKISCREFSGFLDVKRRSAFLFISASQPEEVFISALTNIFTSVLLKKGALVFHGCGVVKDSRAYIFLGPSGAGKSTVARACADFSVLSEELIGVHWSGGSFKAFALPYSGDTAFRHRAGGDFFVSGLFKLIKDRENRLNAIPKAQALADFFILPFGFEKFISFKDYFTRYNQLIATTSCYGLHFLPDNSFWSCIDGCVN
jgi:hypothetical protein